MSRAAEPAATGPEQRCVLSVDDGVATLALTRPAKLNALDAAMARAFGDCLDDLDAARAVVLTGTAEVFSAGWDLNGEDDPDAPRWEDLVDRLSRLPAPTVAALEGHCLGGGMALALACDFRIAGGGARLGFPEVLRGTFAGMGCSARLPRLVGESRAKRLLLFGDAIDASTAAQWGLVDDVTESGHALPRAQEWARRLAAGAPRTQRLIKALLHAARTSDDDGRAAERRAAQSADPAEAQEGRDAFLEKRVPRFPD
jgi:enoyl-CoA hydratase/carnithine racemase